MVLAVLSLLRLLLAALVDFVSPRARLAAENLLLRQQSVVLRRTTRRPRFKPWERRVISSSLFDGRHSGTRSWSSSRLPYFVGTVRPGAGGGVRSRNGNPDALRSHLSCAPFIRRLWRENPTGGQMALRSLDEVSAPNRSNAGSATGIRTSVRRERARSEQHRSVATQVN